MVTGASAGPSEGESPSGTCHRSAGDSAAAAGFSAVAPRARKKYQARTGTAATAPTAARIIASRGPRSLAEGAGATRSMTPAFTSKTQASVTTTGKPTASATTT